MEYYHYTGNRRAAALARRLDRHRDFRVLRRLPRPNELWLAPRASRDAGAITIAVVDAETTGLDPVRDVPIELAVVIVRIDGEGQLTDIAAPLTMLEQPSQPIPLAVELLTGIGDTVVAGKRFDESLVRSWLTGVDVIVSHNAVFDRAFLVRRFPWLTLPWACTIRDIDWRVFGLEGRALGHLLNSAGHFLAHGHRAGGDSWALACLLARTADDGRTIAAHLVEAARTPSRRLYAQEAPFSTREALKAAGYRWHPRRRVWWTEGDDEVIGHEMVFLRSLHPLIRPEVEDVTWFNRHAE